MSTPKNIKKFCLFEGRHELPENEGAICKDFNFADFKAVKTPLWEKAVSSVKEGVGLYVTGLTPALTEFLGEAAKVGGTVVLFHFDRESNSYRWQLIEFPEVSQ